MHGMYRVTTVIPVVQYKDIISGRQYCEKDPCIIAVTIRCLSFTTVCTAQCISHAVVADQLLTLSIGTAGVFLNAAILLTSVL